MPTITRACVCGGEITKGVCDRCGPRRGRAERPDAHERGYDYRWQKATRGLHGLGGWIKRHPICICCLAKGGPIAQTKVVDHITPHRGDEQLLRDPLNWQPLCKSCHDNDKRKIERQNRDEDVRAAWESYLGCSVELLRDR